MMTPKDVRTVRLALGASVEEFSVLLQADPRTIMSWERGESAPTREQRRQIRSLARNRIQLRADAS